MSIAQPGPSSPPAEALRPIARDEEFLELVGTLTNYESMKEYRYDKQSMPLERMRGLARELGDPQDRRPAIHVAGTKGKGTTCLILETLLRASGFRVGCYLSPHLENLRERIRIEGEPVGEQEFCETFNATLRALEGRRAAADGSFPTFFELITALAMLQFERSGVDVGIYEVGLGGRLDATNILRPEWTAITGIALEHTRKLGDTLALIAREKAGIVKPDTPLILGEVPGEARSEILAIAAGRQAPVIESSARRVQRVPLEEAPEGGLLVASHGAPLPARAVRGPGLRADLGLAITLWEEFLARRGRRASREDLLGALDSLSLPGRVEVFPGPAPVVLDGAHTPESLRSLEDALGECRFPRPRTAVVSLAIDKRLDACLTIIDGLADHVILTAAEATRSAPPEDLAARLERLGRSRDRREIVTDPHAALERARAGGDAIIVTGSIYLVGALRGQLRSMS